MLTFDTCMTSPIGHRFAQRLQANFDRLASFSVLFSALLLLASDLIARVASIGWIGALTGLPVPETAGLPVGAVTALLGAPFFLALLVRYRDYG